ncbi:MAG: hypothetical protein ACTSV7_15025 [Candidatus Baldrarchaeia archaeon]
MAEEKLHNFLDKENDEKNEKIEEKSEEKKDSEIVSVLSETLADSETEPLPELELIDNSLIIEGKRICEIDNDSAEGRIKTARIIEEFCRKNYENWKRSYLYIVSLVLPDYSVPNERFWMLCEIDNKIEHLADGRIWYVKNYKSEEEAEQDLLQRLVNYELESWEVIAAMNETPYRWRRRSLQEKLKMLQEAFENSNPYAMASWLKIQVERVMIYPGSETFIELHLASNGEKVKLKGEEILTAKRFREQYFSLTGILLPPLDSKAWCNLINNWSTELGHIDRARKEELSAEQEAAETVIAYIEDSRRVPKKVQAFSHGFFYYDEKQDAIMIPSDVIKDLLESRNIRIDMGKLAFALKDYRKTGSKPVKLENGKVRRFWFFDAKKFNVDLKHMVDLEADENEIGGG